MIQYSLLMGRQRQVLFVQQIKALGIGIGVFIPKIRSLN